MPISTLLVEGKLDVEIMTSILGGRPLVERAGSKNSLKPQTVNKRKDNITAGYLRDRDFDFEPPDEDSKATVDSFAEDGSPLGWRWARHELENYLLDPFIVESACGIEKSTWENVLVTSGKFLYWYQVARWTVGEARRFLPPHYELKTRPKGDDKEFELPLTMDESSCTAWCIATIAEYKARIDDELSQTRNEVRFNARKQRFGIGLFDTVSNVLTWCSGKDLVASLEPETLKKLGCENGSILRNRLRNWVKDNPDLILENFDEWRHLVEMIRQPT